MGDFWPRAAVSQSRSSSPSSSSCSSRPRRRWSLSPSSGSGGATTPSSASATPTPTPATTSWPSHGTASPTPRRARPTAPPSSAAPPAAAATAALSSTSSLNAWDCRWSRLSFLAHGHGDGSFRRGANFAVGSATAVDASVIHDEEPPDTVFPLNVSLSVQLQWFESLKPSLCATPKECQEFFGRSLFFVGELGFNDYSFLLGSGKSVQQVRSSVLPQVVSTISMAIERLIKHGATNLVVSGMLPAGCVPSILALFPGADPGCRKEMNELSAHHNALLQESLEKIRASHPDVELAYAYLFRAVMVMVESPGKY